MWKCPNCGRFFDKKGQMHSCQTKPLEEHFKNKELAKKLFDVLFEKINTDIGKCDIISLPCCIHLYGKYDFLAALPKKDRLEIRFTGTEVLKDPRIKLSVAMGVNSYKQCIDIFTPDDIDKKIMGWLSDAYHLKEKK